MDVTALETALNEARAKVEAATQTVASAMDAKDIKAMLEAAKVLEQAQNAAAKAQRAYEAGTWELRNEERMQVSVALKSAVETFLGTVDLQTPIGLGLRGFDVTFDPESADNPFVVNVRGDKPATSGKAGRPKGTGEGGSSKPRALWMLNGEQIGSAELLERFGGPEGAKAIDKARNYANYRNSAGEPLKYSPGYDSEVKALAKKMGWDGEDTRVLLHEPR